MCVCVCLCVHAKRVHARAARPASHLSSPRSRTVTSSHARTHTHAHARTRTHTCAACMLHFQIGIRGATGEGLLYWYGCPVDGGEMYIPGFSGSITCPVAKTFCFGEDTSGLLYSEIDLTLEWVIWGCIAGGIVITVIVCCALWKKIDKQIHFCCGINADQRDWATVMEKRHGPHSCAAWVLTIFSVLWLLPGLALVGFAVYVSSSSLSLSSSAAAASSSSSLVVVVVVAVAAPAMAPAVVLAVMRTAMRTAMIGFFLQVSLFFCARASSALPWTNNASAVALKSTEPNSNQAKHKGEAVSAWSVLLLLLPPPLLLLLRAGTR
jgi:hypothetical protein